MKKSWQRKESRKASSKAKEKRKKGLTMSRREVPTKK